MPRSPSTTAARVILAPYLLALGWIVFAPQRDARPVTGIVAVVARGLADGLGLPIEPVYAVLEFSANIVLFVPLGLLLAVGLPRLPWWGATLIGLVASVVIELVQLVVPGRVSSLGDVVANTAGAAIGSLILVALRARRRVAPAES